MRRAGGLYAGGAVYQWVSVDDNGGGAVLMTAFSRQGRRVPITAAPLAPPGR